MSENCHPFNETRVITELSGYNWKLTMMFKLEDMPVEKIERNIKMLASIVDSIPSEHPLTKEWTAKVEHYLKKLTQSGLSNFPTGFIPQDDDNLTQSPLSISSSSSDNQLSPISNIRKHLEAQSMNISLDMQSFTLSCTNEKNEITGQIVLSVGSTESPHPNVNRIMGPRRPRRSNSTKAILQSIQDTSTEENPTTIHGQIKKAFSKVAHISGENQTEKMRNLLVLLVKCRIILRANNYKQNNKYLESSIFNWAFTKLNADLAKKFAQKRYRPAFSSLISFLTLKLCTITQPETKYNLAMVCFYCKKAGHFVKDCPQTESITCFNCFQLGHTRHLCRNERVTPKELLDSL